MDSGKLSKLRDYLKSLERVAVCFSGGVDSYLLLHLCTQILGQNNTVGIFCNSDFVIDNDRDDVLSSVKKYNVKTIDINLYTKEIIANDKLRCAYCKQTLLKSIIDKAKTLGFKNVIDGANYSDLLDYRPGLKVSNDLNVLHPYIQCKINKVDIAEFSEHYKLKTAKKSANACYATRIRSGVAITHELIQKIKICEAKVQKLGFKGFRVRVTSDTLRLELYRADLYNIKANILQKIHETLKDEFKYITLDLAGYRPSGAN